jgi:hypothetical protein
MFRKCSKISGIAMRVRSIVTLVTARILKISLIAVQRREWNPRKPVGFSESPELARGTHAGARNGEAAADSGEAALVRKMNLAGSALCRIESNPAGKEVDGERFGILPLPLPVFPDGRESNSSLEEVPRRPRPQEEGRG